MFVSFLEVYLKEILFSIFLIQPAKPKKSVTSVASADHATKFTYMDIFRSNCRINVFQHFYAHRLLIDVKIKNSALLTAQHPPSPAVKHSTYPEEVLHQFDLAHPSTIGVFCCCFFWRGGGGGRVPTSVSTYSLLLGYGRR